MNTVHRHVCNYAVLRFLPYPESDEFVNLGVVVHNATTGRLSSRVETTKHKRVKDFFHELDVESFRQARAAMAAEIRRVEQLQVAPKLEPRAHQDLGLELFLELVRPREAIFRFGEIRTLLTAEPQSVADMLFERYVERQFAQPKEYQETVMARRYFEALKTHRPGQAFERNRDVGSEEYHVRIPICSREVDERKIPRRALKPLDLDRDDSTVVLDHGDSWIARVRRLRGMGRLPERFVFAVRSRSEGLPGEAARDIIARLEDEGVKVGDDADTSRIIELIAD